MTVDRRPAIEQGALRARGAELRDSGDRPSPARFPTRSCLHLKQSPSRRPRAGARGEPRGGTRRTEELPRPVPVAEECAGRRRGRGNSASESAAPASRGRGAAAPGCRGPSQRPRAHFLAEVRVCRGNSLMDPAKSESDSLSEFTGSYWTGRDQLAFQTHLSKLKLELKLKLQAAGKLNAKFRL